MEQVLFDIGHLAETPRTSKEEQVIDDKESVSSASYRALPTSLSSRPSDSSSFAQDIEDIDLDYEPQPKPKFPAMELVIRNLGILQERASAPPTAKTETTTTPSTTDIDYSMEAAIDMKLYNSNLTSPMAKDIPVNRLNPREQEEAGKIV